MKYISHLDLLRLFQRASRRAGLPLSLTEGFNPHPRIRIEPALKLGLESVGLTAEIEMDEYITPGDMAGRLMKELPDGIEVLEMNENKEKYGKGNNRKFDSRGEQGRDIRK